MEPEEPTIAELLERIAHLEELVGVLTEQTAAQKILAASPNGTVVYTISKEDA